MANLIESVPDMSASAPRSVWVDALNVAYWCGPPADLRLPLVLAGALRARGIHVCLVFDASAPHRFAHQAATYARLQRDGADWQMVVPAGRRADGELLRRARATGGCIVSRDRFRDFRSRYRRLIDDPQRVFAGGVVEGRLQVPSLSVDAALHLDAEQALSQGLAATAI